MQTFEANFFISFKMLLDQMGSLLLNFFFCTYDLNTYFVGLFVFLFIGGCVCVCVWGGGGGVGVGGMIDI